VPALADAGVLAEALGLDVVVTVAELVGTELVGAGLGGLLVAAAVGWDVAGDADADAVAAVALRAGKDDICVGVATGFGVDDACCALGCGPAGSVGCWSSNRFRVSSSAAMSPAAPNSATRAVASLLFGAVGGGLSVVVARAVS